MRRAILLIPLLILCGTSWAIATPFTNDLPSQLNSTQEVSSTIKSVLNATFLGPYYELASVYKWSFNPSYGAVLRRPLQENLAYLLALSSVEELAAKALSYLDESKLRLEQVNELMNSAASFNTLSKALSSLDEAKMYLSMANFSLKKLDERVKELNASVPAVSCVYSKAREIVVGIVKSKSPVELFDLLAEAQKEGGISNVVKCYVKYVMEEVVHNYPKFKQYVKEEMANVSSKISSYEKILNAVRMG